MYPPVQQALHGVCASLDTAAPTRVLEGQSFGSPSLRDVGFLAGSGVHAGCEGLHQGRGRCLGASGGERDRVAIVALGYAVF